MRKPFRILLTNDDGIDSESIWALKRNLSDMAHCEIVAPRYPRSASSHAVSLHDRISVHRVRRNGRGTGYGVDGTPVDAIKFALSELFKKEPFDLIISGINLGPNTGVSVYYSGTIGAAREGVISGIPSFAVSIAAFEWNDFSYALNLTKRIARCYLSGKFPPDYFLNVNIPAVARTKVRGIRLSRQAPSRFVELFERAERKGKPSYLLKGKISVLKQDGSTDQEVLEQNYVSITPLCLDMTHYSYMKKTKGLIRSLEDSLERKEG